MEIADISLLEARVIMRDGIALSTDIYLPAGEGPYPVLIERTPYNKRGTSRHEKTAAKPTSQTRPEVAHWFAARGYAVVMQDCRGRYGSQGTFTKYVNEAEDGFDTLNWIIQQPWCNGKIGTMGMSYGAHTQTSLAALNPPGLSAMFLDSGGFSSAYHSGIRQGGCFELKQATWAYRHALLSPETAKDPRRKAALDAVDIADWFKRFPWRRGESPLSAAPEYENYLFEQWEAGLFNEDWRIPALYAEGHYAQFPDIPVAIIGSWYDPYVKTCITNYLGLRQSKTSPIRLIMGPWSHGARSTTYAGNTDFGPASTLEGLAGQDYFQFRLNWFDWHLKGQDENAALFTDNIRFFRMGGGSGCQNPEGRLQHGGDWEAAEQWPPRQAQKVIWYLHANGELGANLPEEAFAQFTYNYDPANPVPTIGGAVTSGEPVMRPGGFDQREDESLCLCQQPGRALSDRDDVISFSSPPLDSGMDVSGSIKARLWVSSDCPDTDFAVKLIDVYPPSDDYPQGFALNISQGILRMRYREGWERETFMRPDEIYHVDIELFDVSNYFAAGHRIRIDVSSSNYPHFDRNTNSGEPEGRATKMRIARNKVHTNSDHPSCIEISLIT